MKANTIYSETYELKKNFNNLTFAVMNGNQLELRSALVLFRIFLQPFNRVRKLDWSHFPSDV